MNLKNNLNELLNAQVITKETAQKIEAYYQNKTPETNNRLFVVFGILGAILIGLGIILILAHNWDNLSRGVKLFFAFLPLLLGQGLCGFTLLKKPESTAWRESSAVFLFFAVGASIALVSQIYNLPGEQSTFILTWLLLCLPLIYIMKSSIVSLFSLVWITWYTVLIGYDGRFKNASYLNFCILLLTVLPHYLLLCKNKAQSNFTTIHHWFIPLSVIITLASITVRGDGEIMFIAYVNLFGILYMLGNLPYFKKQSLFRNGYRVLGAVGTIIVLLILSFDWFWEDLRMIKGSFYTKINLSQLIATSLLTLTALGLFFRELKEKSIRKMEPITPVFIIFSIIFIIGFYSLAATVLINFLLFGTGVMTVLKGIRDNHFGILNYGLMIITVLVTCRFFDSDLSFVWRGILFVLVGAGFFITNYWMLKKRQTDEL